MKYLNSDGKLERYQEGCKDVSYSQEGWKLQLLIGKKLSYNNLSEWEDKSGYAKKR